MHEQTQGVPLVLCNVVPDEGKYRNPALSRAANMFMTNLIGRLGRHYASSPHVMSFPPFPAFPRGPLWVGRAAVRVGSGVDVVIAPYLNVKVLKNVVAELYAVLAGVGVRRRIEYVLTYNLTFPGAWAALLLAAIRRVPAFAIVVDVDIPGEDRRPDNPLRRIEYFMQTRLIRKFDGIVVCTPEIAEAYAPDVPALILEGGVNEEFQQPGWSALERVEDDVFTIVYAGRLSRQHGVDLLLEAFRELPGPHFRLVAAGNGPLEEDVVALARVDARVSFLGYVPFAELHDVYRKADVLLSLWRTNVPGATNFFPSKLLDYLASGRPVISTATPYIEREFGSSCILLEEERAQALRDLLLGLSRTPFSELVDLGRRAQTFVLTRKTWEHQTERLVRFLRGQESVTCDRD